MLFALIGIPLLLGAAALAVPSNRWRPCLLPLAGGAHLALLATGLCRPEILAGNKWLSLDPLGKPVLLLVSILFFFCAIYSVGYLRQRGERGNRIFCACLLGFLGMMNLVALAQHLGLMWIAVEATALVSAPLIYFNRTPRSLEATWKYLLIGSVGIALALLGTFFLAYAFIQEGTETSLLFHDLLRLAPVSSKPWLHAAFALLLVGYGTKMGLAPMHTWKPDAYGEAPGMVGALLAGGLTNCAFLALLRIYHICVVAGEGAHVSKLLVTMGLLSMAVAGVFMVGQRDFKRMLAYSSVEHMGILILGIGVGGSAVFASLLHMFNNGLTKGVLFLSAGNIHRAYGSKNLDQVHGAMRRLPLSAGLFLAGFFAITGSPPFGPFISEFSILNAAFGAGSFWTGGLFLLFLLVIFIGMGATVLAVVQGSAPGAIRHTPYRDSLLTCAPPLVLLALVLLLGLHIPAPLRNLLADAVSFLETTQ
jgi:hydrogenase-4 component F